MFLFTFLLELMGTVTSVTSVTSVIPLIPLTSVTHVTTLHHTSPADYVIIEVAPLDSV
jgi:hypothetical protein